MPGTYLRELLPDRAPFQAWANFEFRDRDGKWHEVDALVLGERRLHLVELNITRHEELARDHHLIPSLGPSEA